MVSALEDIGARQHMLPLNTRIVHERAVRAVVNKDIASRSSNDLGVPPRHIFRTDHDIATGVAANQH